MTREEALSLRIGDQVVCLNSYMNLYTTINKIYTVVQIGNDGYPDSEIRIMNDRGNQWWVYQDSFRPYISDQLIDEAIALVNKMVHEVNKS